MCVLQDVGKAVLESYSRVLEGAASNLRRRIRDVLDSFAASLDARNRLALPPPTPHAHNKRQPTFNTLLPDTVFDQVSVSNDSESTVESGRSRDSSQSSGSGSVAVPPSPGTSRFAASLLGGSSSAVTSEAPGSGGARESTLSRWRNRKKVTPPNNHLIVTQRMDSLPPRSPELRSASITALPPVRNYSPNPSRPPAGAPASASPLTNPPTFTAVPMSARDSDASVTAAAAMVAGLSGSRMHSGSIPGSSTCSLQGSPVDGVSDSDMFMSQQSHGNRRLVSHATQPVRSSTGHHHNHLHHQQQHDRVSHRKPAGVSSGPSDGSTDHLVHDETAPRFPRSGTEWSPPQGGSLRGGPPGIPGGPGAGMKGSGRGRNMRRTHSTGGAELLIVKQGEQQHWPRRLWGLRQAAREGEVGEV